jgi:hypothetical protein
MDWVHDLIDNLFEIGFTYTDLIIAVGDQLELLGHGSTYRKLTLNSYNASKLSALAYDSIARTLYFSDSRHLQSHVLSVSLEDESQRQVEEVVQSKSSIMHWEKLFNLLFFKP